ncbi:MAG: VIT domain-containing protein [Candidatus Latescibacterota bacterium]
MGCRGMLLTAVLALPAYAWGIGYVYTGVGGGGRAAMELTSVQVEVRIADRVAVTRVDQVFTNRSASQVEGIYEFVLPQGAFITDLVLWIGDRRVQGLIMEKEEARRTYDAIVGRRLDPALVEQVSLERFRLSIFPFPAQGSRRVELEYAQVLQARAGVATYAFPLAPEVSPPPAVGTFAIEVRVTGQHPFRTGVSGAFAAATQTEQTTEREARVFYADEGVVPDRDFALTLTETGERRLPTVISLAPRRGQGDGYYALWLPPLRELTEGTPLPRAVTFVIDISSSMRDGRLDAVKAALGRAIDGLGDADVFDVVAFSNTAASLAGELVAATAANRQAASAFVSRQGALGATNYEAALVAALANRAPEGRVHHVVFLTDGYPTLGETDPARLGQLIARQGAADLRLFAIGVGSQVNASLLRSLAEAHRGQASFVSDDQGIEADLRLLFEEFSRPIFLPAGLSFAGTGVSDEYPRSVEVLAAGDELFQVGRYTPGGPVTLTLSGRLQDGDLSLQFPLELASADTSLAIVPRLWAHQKVQALEGLLGLYGHQQEVLDDILSLGLGYRLVTRRTSLFAPDEQVVVNPEVAAEEGVAATAVEAETQTASWSGKTFVLSGAVWVDLAYRAGMPLLAYEDLPDPPEALAAFARPDALVIVVLGDRAYRLRPGVLPAGPVLAQNWPNPFNASTLIRFHVPADLAPAAGWLTVYDLTGQGVRTLARGLLAPGEHQVSWDGRDERGVPAASGVYLYRLQVGGQQVTRRLLLLR